MGVKIVQSDAVNTIKSTKNRSFDKRRNLIRAVMVPIDSPDTPEVAGRPGYVWCRDKASMTSDSGGVFEAFNPHVIPLNNRPVWIEPSPRAPYRMTVVGCDFTTLADSVIYGGDVSGAWSLPRHGNNHTYIPGTPNADYSTDIVNVTERNISSGRVYPTSPASMRCVVAPVSYIYSDQVRRYSGGTTQDFTANIPGAGLAEIDYVCINGATNALAYVRTSTFSWATWTDPLPPSIHVTIPVGYIVLSCIILYNGMTEIVERNFTYEIRPLFHSITDPSSIGSVTDFTDLGDVPGSYATFGSHLVAVNATATGLEFIDPVSGGILAFIDLTDVPASYAAFGEYLLRVNAAENAVEFANPQNIGYWKPVVDSTPEIVYSIDDVVMAWEAP